MEKHKSQGEAMHYVYLSMPEGDSRRHKARCIFYKKGICLCKDNSKCTGSAFCEQYEEHEPYDSRVIQEPIYTNNNSCKEDLCNKTYKIYVSGKNINKQ